MKKRALTAILWSYAGWYAGAMVATVFGMSPWLGPVVAVATFGIVLGATRQLNASRIAAHH